MVNKSARTRKLVFPCPAVYRFWLDRLTASLLLNFDPADLVNLSGLLVGALGLLNVTLLVKRKLKHTLVIGSLSQSLWLLHCAHLLLIWRRGLLLCSDQERFACLRLRSLVEKGRA